MDERIEAELETEKTARQAQAQLMVCGPPVFFDGALSDKITVVGYLYLRISSMLHHIYAI